MIFDGLYYLKRSRKLFEIFRPDPQKIFYNLIYYTYVIDLLKGKEQLFERTAGPSFKFDGTNYPLGTREYLQIF